MREVAGEQITSVRLTPQTAAVLRALLDAPEEGLYGLQVAQDVGLPTGSVFPILARLEHAKWVSSAWEAPEQAAAAGRHRRRRYYQLTSPGRRAAREVVPEVGQIWVQRLGLLQPGDVTT